MKTTRMILILLLSIVFIQCSNDNDTNLEFEAKLTLSSNCVSLSNSKTYEIIDIIDPEGSCYEISSDYNIARVQLNGNKLIIIGVNIGEAVITVGDSEGKKAKIQVSIDNLVRPTIKTDVVYVKRGGSRTFSHPYSTESGCILLTDQNSKIVNTTLLPDSLIVEGRELGQTTLSVQKDYWYLYQYVIRVVDVYPLEIPMIGYSVFPRSGHFGGPIAIGNGDYRVESSNPSVAVATIVPYSKDWEKTNYNYNEASLDIESFGKPGVAILTITDAAGQTATVEVEVREKN